MVFTAAKLIRLFNALTDEWDHDQPLVFRRPQSRLYDGFVRELHFCNLFQWQMENAVRKEITGDECLRLKRLIDESNFCRNTLMEAIDEHCHSHAKDPETANDATILVNSETLGQMSDRLSILSLKRFFLSQVESPGASTSKVADCARQIEHVSFCYDRFAKALVDGKARTIAYKQHKTFE